MPGRGEGEAWAPLACVLTWCSSVCATLAARCPSALFISPISASASCSMFRSCPHAQVFQQVCQHAVGKDLKDPAMGVLDQREHTTRAAKAPIRTAKGLPTARCVLFTFSTVIWAEWLVAFSSVNERSTRSFKSVRTSCSVAEHVLAYSCIRDYP